MFHVYFLKKEKTKSNIPSSTRCPPGHHFQIRLQRRLYQWRTHGNPVIGAESLPLFCSTQNRSHDIVSITDQERFWPPETSGPRAEGDLKVPLIPVHQLLEFSPQYFHQWLHNSGNCCLNMFTDKNLLSHLVALTQKNLPYLDPELSFSSPSVTHYLLHPSLSILATVSSQRKSIAGSFNALYMTWSPLSLCVSHWFNFDLENGTQNWMYFSYDPEQCAHAFINSWILEHVFVLETWSSGRQEWTRHKLT